MSEGIWTVEGPFFHDQAPNKYLQECWAIMDEDGEQIEFFPTREEAEEALAFQQEAALEAARGDR